jgi:hypothetical protein
MNRIILIGNGFDLAHGLNTRYTDFIDDFWDRMKKIIRFYGISYEDNIIKISILENRISGVRYPSDVNGYDWFKELVGINKINNNYQTNLITIGHKNAFLKTITEKSTLQNWVDIEEEYYRTLNKCLKDESGKEVEKLNGEFTFIKSILKEYLTTQKYVNEHSEKIERSIFSELKHDNIIRKPANENLDKILLLSFNYTNTEVQYIHNDNRISDVVHIHGELENPDNPIIFGYGDEMGEEYKTIENKNDNRYFENIKSFKYLETNNYKRMLKFIDADEYQIFIMGHSCGLSDRVLLNTLFEHKNCFSIKVFYRKIDNNTDNFSDVVMNMSRCFNNKSLIREIVVDKANSEPLS